MANNLLKPLFDLLDNGYSPGESFSHWLRKLKGQGAGLETSLKGRATLSGGVLGNSESFDAFFVAPFDLEITAIKAVKGTLSGTAVTATLNNRDAAGNNSKNPLSGTNIDLDGLTTADEPEAQTLSATQANKEMKAGDALRCTFACDGSSTLQGAGVLIEYKPIAGVSF